MTEATAGGSVGPAGSTLRLSGKDGPQQIASGGARWTDEAEARFLNALATTCNVTRSAEAAGFSAVAIYRRRRMDAGFAIRWQHALAQGYARLEAALLRRATDVFADVPEPDPETPLAPVSFAEAVTLLKLHHAEGARARNPGHGRPRPRPLVEVRGAILVRLEAIAAKRAGHGYEP